MAPKRKSDAPESSAKKFKSLHVGDQFPDLGPIHNDEDKPMDLKVCDFCMAQSCPRNSPTGLRDQRDLNKGFIRDLNNQLD
jgi:hypothetical protein